MNNKSKRNIEENEKTIKKNNYKRNLKILSGVIVIVILFLVLYQCIYAKKPILYNQTKATKFGLENVGELVTQTSYTTVVKDVKNSKELFNSITIPFTESRQIFSYDIKVDASVDFSKITFDFNDENNEIAVKLPHAKIYNATMDENSLKVYLDTEGLFSRINLNDNNEARKAMKVEGIETAKSNGILDAGDNNAQKLIEGLVKSDSKYKNYNIKYEYIN